MNKNEKLLLVGIAIVSGVTALRYGFSEEKIEAFGLSSMQTKRFIAGVAVLSISVLLISELSPKARVA